MGKGCGGDDWLSNVIQTLDNIKHTVTFVFKRKQNADPNNTQIKYLNISLVLYKNDRTEQIVTYGCQKSHYYVITGDSPQVTSYTYCGD